MDESIVEEGNEFTAFVDTYYFHPETVSRLQDEGLDEISILEDFPVTEINLLKLKPNQEKKLAMALKDLQRRNYTSGMEIKEWSLDKGLDQDTVGKLIDGGITNIRALIKTTAEALILLQIKAGDRVKLQRAIKEMKAASQYASGDTGSVYGEPKISLPDDDYVAFLKCNRLKENTIRKILDKDWDSKDSLPHMEKTDIDELGLTKPQRLHLEEIITIIKRNSGMEDKPTAFGQHEPVDSLTEETTPDPTHLPETDFVKMLKEKFVKVPNIQKLLKAEWESIRALRYMEESDIDVLGFTKPQKLILLDIITEAKESVEQENLPPCYVPPQEFEVPLPQYFPQQENDFVMNLKREHLKDETIRKLQERDWDTFQALHHMDESDVDALDITKPQKIALGELIKSMQTSPTTKRLQVKPEVRDDQLSAQDPLPENDFVMKLKRGHLKEETIRKLLDNDWDTVQALQHMDESDVIALHLTKPQKISLMELITDIKIEPTTEEVHDDEHSGLYPVSDALPSNEYVRFLQENHLKDISIRKLFDKDWDTFHSLQRMDENDVDELKFKNPQKLYLLDALKKCKTIPKADSTNRSRPKTPDPLPECELVNCLLRNDVKEETIRQLLEEGYESVDILRRLQESDFSDLQISEQEERILLAIVDELNDMEPSEPVNQVEAFIIILKELSLSDTTIRTLQEHGLDNPDSLILADKEALDNLKIPNVQRRLLEKAIEKLNSDVEDAYVFDQEIISPMDFNIGNSANTIIPKEPKKPTGITTIWATLKKGAGYVKSGISNVADFLAHAGHNEKPKNIKKNGMRILKLPVEHVYQDKEGKVRKCIVGKPKLKAQQKTIMIVGSTGAGKSTLIDGLCNYIFDTKWEERSRFKLIDEHEDELRNAHVGQAISQTEWITIYSINCGKSNRLPYTLNLIDTPGFGDTRGIDRDEKLVEQIRHLFDNKGQHEIDELHAVCFVTKAPDARLTPTQRYIFNEIMSVFGRDIEGNILVMLTFADGAEAPALEAIKAAKLPYKKAFSFNNSALFANNGYVPLNTHEEGEKYPTTPFGKMFWDMSIKSFEVFFTSMETLNPKSLVLTVEVLEQRRNLKDTLVELEKKVRIGLATMDELKKEEKYFKENEDRIKDTSDFTYITTKHFSVKVDCEAGRNVTHCMVCHQTCHGDCIYRDDDDKLQCCVIDNDGNCRVCQNHCPWTEHKNTGYYLEHKTRQIEQTLENKLKEFQLATGVRAQKKDIIDVVQKQYDACQKEVQDYVRRCRDILQRLKEIALKPDPLTEIEYIQELIKNEKDDHEEGWQQRVEQLESIKKKVEVLKPLL